DQPAAAGRVDRPVRLRGPVRVRGTVRLRGTERVRVAGCDGQPEAMTATASPATEVAAPVPPARPRWLVGMLFAVLALALVALGGGLAVVTGVGRAPEPSDGSVDAGFARDMITHHTQAVQMAQVVRDHGTDPALRLLAFDIETQQ